MINAIKTIETNFLLKSNEKIGVAVSGGIDSMCLLHFLNSQKKKYNIEIVAINIDHQIRPNSSKDSKFVIDYCKENNITCHSFKVDALSYSKLHKLTLEEGARICRYGVFDSLLKKKIIDKIAIAHHKQDQVETIMLNLFRGSGLKGVSGMEYSYGCYIRPFLDTDKSEILAYQSENNIPFVEDETNQDIEYSRNYLRQSVIPILKDHWKNFENNIINFSKICKQDDSYIDSNICYDNLVFEKKLVKIPLNMFVFPPSITNRVIRKALAHLNALKDIEQKHLKIITQLALESDNGTRINLPNNLMATKEYDYLTLHNKAKNKVKTTYDFRTGKQEIFDKKIEIKKTKKIQKLSQEKTHIMDYDSIPKNAIWRSRENGDVFTKFGGGTKKLKDYFIDKKIPNRLRNEIPVLALGNEIFVVLGVEISDKIKINENTKNYCVIKY